MTTTSFITDKPLLQSSVLLQNLPIPLGGAFDTLTQDYDQCRFFLPPMEGIKKPAHITQRDIFARLYNLLDIHRKELHLQEEFAWVSGHGMTMATVGENIIQAITSWLSMPETRKHTAPLQFRVFKANLSIDILRFCSQHGILSYLTIAIDLIETCFSMIHELDLGLEQDPETGEEWLMLDLTIQGEVDEVLDNYDNYTDYWVSSVPWPERDKIRLSYNII